MSDIMERIRKLMALAERGGTEAEAETAMRKVHEVLAAHNLTMAEVAEAELKDNREQERTHENFDMARTEEWTVTIWDGIAQMYFCRYFLYRGMWVKMEDGKHKKGIRHVLIGKRCNVAVASEMAMYLIQTIITLSRKESRSPAFKTAFRKGAADRLFSRMISIRYEKERANRQTTTETNALVLADFYKSEAEKNAAYLRDVMKIEFGKPHKDRTKDARNTPGYHAGKDAADRISLDTQIEGKKETRRIDNA